MNRIEKFIEDNKLDFTDSGSSLNSNVVIIAGYALHIELSEDELVEDIGEIEDVDLESDAGISEGNFISLEDELRRVFKFAEEKAYGDWWIRPEAKKMYKF